jgi:hypothetical protein
MGNRKRDRGLAQMILLVLLQVWRDVLDLFG